MAAIPFLFIFVSILLTHITLIVVVATMLNNNIPARTFRRKDCHHCYLAGHFRHVPVWFFKTNTLGFILLLFSLLTYILWSHVVPKVVQQRNNPEDDFAPTQVI